jgi:hypothetical protein
MGHITLIPKVASPENINEYRPITLLNYVLKLLTKFLANRLQKVVLKIVHKNQYGFLEGRTIQDYLAWAMEFLYQCESSRQEIILLKIDFAKAFDTNDHAAMLRIMKQMGFDERWISWIDSIFSSGKSAVLLNGVPGRQFFCKRGVGHGDPLSPLIFVLVADLLQSAINKAFLDGTLRARFSPYYGMDFPVIQYADDTLVIMQADQDQVLVMKHILELYAQSTGLKINFHKSSMVPINLASDRAQIFADLLGCKIASLPFTYLGLPLGTTKPTIQDLKPLVDRIERRVSANFMLMSYSGKVTLINSLLTSIATFTMCSIQLNPKILEHIEKIRRHCLWVKKNEEGEEKCYSLASWQMVCKPKKKGGLGILNLKLQNEALLLKCLHKFYNKLDTPWVHMLWNTYYQGRVPHAMDPVCSFWWRDIYAS